MFAPYEDYYERAVFAVPMNEDKKKCRGLFGEMGGSALHHRLRGRALW